MEESALMLKKSSDSKEQKQTSKDKEICILKLVICLAFLCNFIVFAVLQAQVTALQTLIDSSSITTNITTTPTHTVMDIFTSLFHPTHNVSTEVPNPNYRVAPLFVLMDNFLLKLYLKEHWESEPFLAFERGSLISLSIYPAGHGDGEGNYLSIYVNLMKGPYDDELEQSGQWPMRGTFTLKLHDLYNTECHCYITPDYSVCELCTFRVREETLLLIYGAFLNACPMKF